MILVAPSIWTADQSLDAVARELGLLWPAEQA